jgi:hypothetical protein
MQLIHLDRRGAPGSTKRAPAGPKVARDARPPARTRQSLPFWCTWEWLLLAAVCLAGVVLGVLASRTTPF